MGGLGNWNFAVKKYVGDMSKLKDKTPKIGVVKPMVWNGEYPVNDQGIQFCPKTSSGQPGASGSGRPPKRGDGESCALCSPDTTKYRFMIPNRDVPRAVIDAFTNRLKRETDPKTLYVLGGEIPISSVKFWKQAINDTMAATYAKDPAVSEP